MAKFSTVRHRQWLIFPALRIFYWVARPECA